jgi:sialate O-acetylesterase
LRIGWDTSKRIGRSGQIGAVFHEVARASAFERQTVGWVRLFSVALFGSGFHHEPMITPKDARISILVSTLVALSAAQADVRLPGFFSSNMALQQKKPVPIWGWADDGEKVKVEINGKSVEAEAQNGKWKATLPELTAGGPYTMKVSGKNSLELTNVVVGEVWLASGQSNMEFPLRASFEAQKDIDSSANDDIRLFTVPKTKSDKPLDDVKGSWQVCSKESVPNFSAVGYYFGRDLQKALHVPVGIVHTSWGGSPAEVWMSNETLAANKIYKSEILDPYEAQAKKAADWDQEAAELKKAGKEVISKRPGLGWKPSELYNGMIAPLVPMAIQGAIWYQGESNAGKAWQYRMLFADMISNWRFDFGQGDFSFLEVQLAPWDKGRRREMSVIASEPVESDWAELREAQTIATQILPKVGMAIITDVGDKDDIHPTKKQPVGSRLALLARQITYGERVAGKSPAYRSLDIKGSEAVVTFVNAPGGLKIQGDKLTGFAIAGADRKFYWADAKIERNRVILTSDKVPNPVAVRYGWADYPVVNLFSQAGLPASPFRTDAFPMVTGPYNR